METPREISKDVQDPSLGQEREPIDYEVHLTSMLDEFNRFAGSCAPPIRFALPHENVKTAQFSVRVDGAEEVVLGTDFFTKNNLSLTQAEWVVKHELGHFRDYVSDKVSYLSTAEKSMHYGIDLTMRIANAYQEKYGEELPDARRQILARQLVKIYASTYFNTLDDVWVNHTVATDPAFAPRTQGDEEREALYRNVLSPTPLLSEDTFESSEMMQAILRGENIPEGVRLAEGAQRALSREYRIMGANVDTQTLIDTYLNPLRSDGTIDTTTTACGLRHRIMERTILPEFTELLLRDVMRALEDYKDSDAAEMDKFFDQMIAAFERMFPDFIPNDIIAKWGEATETAKARAKSTAGRKTSTPVDPEKQYRDALEKAQKEWREKHDITEEEHKRMKGIEKDISQFIAALNELWKSISHRTSIERSEGQGGTYKTGNAVSIPEVIRQYPSIIAEAFPKLRVMMRIEKEERQSNNPEQIDLSVIIDQSGSMGEKGSDKNKAVERVTLLLMRSLEMFNQYLDSTRDETRSKLSADTEVILYGDDAVIAKPFRKNGGLGRDRIAQYKVMNAIGENRGGTYEEPAFDLVLQSLDDETRGAIRDGKLQKIVFLITDGGTSPRPELMERITKMEDAGAHLYAIQIGDVSDDEIESFNNTWITNRERPLGVLVGSDLSKLAPAITEFLFEELRDIEL